MPAEVPARRVVARAPARIDLGGGWTDVPPYCDEQGGFVCNVAITRYATATITPLTTTPPPHPSPRTTPRTPPPSPQNALITAALHRTNTTNAQVTLTSDFPVGAGLGGSSTASAALLGALHAWNNMHSTPRQIAELGRTIEIEDLGIAGGRQDHYAATHGGALALEFSTSVTVRRLAVSKETVDALVRRSLLIYTGESRISGETITAVLAAYHKRHAPVLHALAQLKSLARHMADALESGDINALGALVGEHWTHQRSLHAAIPTERIDTIIARATRAGALGAKAMGASGGGCVLVICPEEGISAVTAAVRELGERLSFGVDTAGLQILT